MTEKPILFSGPMVRAILDGRKTQTRRVVKPQPEWIESSGRWCWPIPKSARQPGYSTHCVTASREWHEYMPDGCCPFGQPGDHLWVRETFLIDDTPTGPLSTDSITRAVYAADFPNAGSGPWTPSIHMPRWASRLTLEVTGIRVERVQDISEADAKAEGVSACTWYAPYGKGEEAHIDISHLPGFPDERISYRNGFANLWDSINAKRGYGWEANPWVWVVEFKRVENANGNG